MTPTQRCGAKTKAGTPCPNYPMHGGKRCDKHGGKSPRALVKAAENVALAKAHKYLQALGADTIPYRESGEALQDIGNQASLLVDLLRGVIGQLDTVASNGGAGVGEQIRGEVQAYLQSMTRAESIHGRIISLDLDKRHLLLEEAKVLILVAALDQVLGSRELNLTTEQQKFARTQLVKRLEPHTHDR